MYVFRSKIHEIYTQHISKLALSYLDDKRFIRDNSINTYAWGHYAINSQQPSSSSSYPNENVLTSSSSDNIVQ